jgi:CDP-6-deoxy-D-xylo-4-hexulose-3-dehydrase
MKKVWYAPNKFESYGEEEIKAVEQCLRDGWLAGFGPRSIEFEEKIAKFFGKKYGVFVNSGSSACLLALEEVLAAVDNEVKVLMIPNLIGNKPNWKAIKDGLAAIGREDIVLIEDSADTITHTPETDIATTSFYASHVITAGGAGGMVMFNDEKLRNVSLQFRDWGRIGDNSEEMSDRFNHNVDGIPYDYKFLYGVLGYNMKSSEMNAAFGLVQLEKFKQFEQIRRANIERYIENLQGVGDIILPDDSIKPNWLAIPLQTEKRYELLHFLEENNIQTRVTFAGNVTRHPVYREYLQEFNNSDTIMKNGFLLGAHHGMTVEDVDYVCDKIKEFFNK